MEAHLVVILQIRVLLLCQGSFIYNQVIFKDNKQIMQRSPNTT